MFSETIDLYREFGLEKESGRAGTLTVYGREQQGDLARKTRPGILVVPGGGYHYCSDREQEPVALRFLAAGYTAFTLRYSVCTTYPVPLLEGAMAMAYIRLHADRYGVDPAHVAAIGFSAGGHLAGMLATMFDDEPVKRALKEKAALVRPDAAILCYGVLSTGEFTNDETTDAISGGDPRLRGALSVETRVTPQSVPAFLWHTAEDGLVPVENSLLTAAAYRKAGVPFELHIFEKGRHGLSVASEETEYDQSVLPSISHIPVWTDLALAWLKNRGFAVKTA